MKIQIKYYEKLTDEKMSQIIELGGWEEVNISRVVLSNGQFYRWYYL